MTRVFVIEDELQHAERLAQRLRHEKYEVVIVPDGEEGLEKVRENPPDLIVLDIMLPGLDGLTLCRILRRDNITSHIPIIMLTARGAEIDKIIGLEIGADDYLVKPVSLDEFTARVQAVLRRANRSVVVREGDVLKSEDLKVEILSRKVFLGDAEIKLSNKEFGLLAEFMRNKGIVISRDLILARVWEEDIFIDKRTVDVHVRWLRIKIEDNPDDPQRIKTIRGVGYRFER